MLTEEESLRSANAIAIFSFSLSLSNLYGISGNVFSTVMGEIWWQQRKACVLGEGSNAGFVLVLGWLVNFVAHPFPSALSLSRPSPLDYAVVSIPITTITMSG